MYQKVRLKRKLFKEHKPNILNKIILIFALLIFFIVLTFRFINKKVSPILMDYAESYIKKVTNLIINKAISKQLSEQLNIDDLFIITKDGNDYIRTIDFNPTLVNKALTIITNNIQLNLKYLEEGKLDSIDLPNNVEVKLDNRKSNKGIIYEIPSGVIFNNSLLANLGPKIPVKLSLIGDIVSNVNARVTNYGINNALIEVSVTVSVEEMVLLPITSKKIKVESSVPVAMKLVQGIVPNYYFNGLDKNSPSLALSME